MRLKEFYISGLIVLFGAGNSFAQMSKRALFIGNSYTAYNNLPSLTAEVAASAGDTLEFDSNTPGGTSFATHSTNATSLSKIEEGNWDYVILQEQSQIPSFPLTQVEEDCFPYAEALVEHILEFNPCATPLFYMTWGRENGDAQNCANWPPVCTYEGMDDLLRERYMMLGEMNNAEVSPVGAVWRHVRENFPDVDLYNDDGSHPSAAGSYLAAVCHYTSIFRKDPLLTSYNYTVDDNYEQIIRQAVHDIVFSEMSNWYIGDYDPAAEVLTEETGLLTYAFTNTSSFADEVMLVIEGQEIILTDVYTHTFSAPGNYDIVITAGRCGRTDTSTFTLNVTSSDVAEIGSGTLSIAPNPATDQISFNFDLNCIEVYDLSGKYVTTLHVSNRTADISGLAQGVYHLVHEEKTFRLVAGPR